MTRRFGGFLAVALAAASCDGAKRPEAARLRAPLPSVVFKGRRFETTLVLTERDRRMAPSRFSALPEDRAYLLAWPRERYMKLESGSAKASFDVAFLDLSGRVVDRRVYPRGLVAGDPEGLMPEAEAAYALLVTPGTLGRAGLQKGDLLELSPEVRGAKAEDLPAVRIGEILAYAELALTETERQHGLMFRPRLSADDGMLFVYPGDEWRTFWMKNTLIPLDIAFFQSNGKLVNVVEIDPYPDPSHPPSPYPTAGSSEPARFALEMNRGWFRKRELVGPDGRPKPGIQVRVPPEALGGFPE